MESLVTPLNWRMKTVVHRVLEVGADPAVVTMVTYGCISYTVTMVTIVTLC